MPSLIDFAGEAVEPENDVWTHGVADSHLPTVDRVILDLIDRLGYTPAEVAKVLRFPLSHVAGTYWRSRWSAHRVANRIADVLRNEENFDPRHAMAFELSAVCGYTFVEIGQVLGYDRGHACRIAQQIAERLRQRLPADADETDEHSAQLISALPAIDEQQTARECRLTYARNETLRPIQRIQLWREMLDAGDFVSKAALARACGVSHSSVRNHLVLLNLPAEWIERVVRDELPLSFLRPLVRIRDDPRLLTLAKIRLDECARRPNYVRWCEIVARLSSTRKHRKTELRRAA